MSAKPILFYDARNAFARMCQEYARTLLGDRAEWESASEQDHQHGAVAAITTDGAVLRGAAGFFHLLGYSSERRWLLSLYEHAAPFRWLADRAFRFFARHPRTAEIAKTVLVGRHLRPLRYELTESVFLRLLGLVFLFAFSSLASQIVGLIGSKGIMPCAPVLTSLRGQLGAQGFWLAPSVFWLGAGDGALWWGGIAGIFVSLALMAGNWLGQAAQRFATLACFFLYLSFTTVGQPFMLFQWDALLTETAFLALFAGSPLLVWGFRVLLFRLMFESGVVKLISGDVNWSNLHALRFHFMTQPLPNPLAYYLHHAPEWLLDSLTWFTLFVELICPWMLFLPRRIRHIGAALLIVLQAGILLTGNFAFFNLLSITICLWAFDDCSFSGLGKFLRPYALTIKNRVARQAAAAVVCVLIFLGLLQVRLLFRRDAADSLRSVFATIGPWQIVNSYGLFAVMTTTRPEIVFEGSEDGQNWKEYSFPYKPGDVKGSLPIVAPHQPRLDWQLWFAALEGNYAEERWTGNLAVRLLQGEPSVLRLLNPSPFSEAPKFVRALLYDYRFTTAEERQKTGAIWSRRLLRTYIPAVSLEMVSGSR